MSLALELLESGNKFKLAEVVAFGGKTVHVRQLSAYEQCFLEQRLNGGKDFDNMRGWVAAKCVVDDKGNRVFTDADIPALNNLPSESVNPVYEKVMVLSKIIDDEGDAKNG